MAKKLSRAYWKGKFYFRDSTGTWRENVGGKVVKANRNVPIERLRSLEKGSHLIEPTMAHSYSGRGMSKEKAEQAVRLFRPKIKEI